MYETIMVDLSRHNGEVDFFKMAEQGITHVALRASVGDYYKDTRFASYWGLAGEAGLKRTAYHPIAPALDDRLIDGPANMANFFEAIGSRELEWYPVLDCELDRGVSPGKLTNIIKRCVDLCNERWGRSIIYTRGEWWRRCVERRDFWQELTDLWIARYVEGLDHPWEDAPSTDPIDWETWALWQYTSKGNGPKFGTESKSVDLNWKNPDYELVNFDGGDNNVMSDMDKLIDKYNYLKNAGIVPLVVLLEGGGIVVPDPGNGGGDPGGGGEPEPPQTPSYSPPEGYGKVIVRNDSHAHFVDGYNDADKPKPIMIPYPKSTDNAKRDRVFFNVDDSVYVKKNAVVADGGARWFLVDNAQPLVESQRDGRTLPELYVLQNTVMKTW